MKPRAHVCIAMLLMLSACLLHAQVPRALSYQGVLTDSAGRPKPDGPYSFAFRLYPSASGGTALWTEIRTLLVSRGLFSTVLGEQVPVNLSFDGQYWLSIQVAADPELSPRIPMTSVGYSIRSVKADTAQYAMTAPQQTYVDSARIAGSIPNNIVTTAKIVDGAVTQAKLAPGVSLPPGGTAGGDLAGTYPNPTITAGAVSTGKIADGAVTQAKLAPGLSIPPGGTAGGDLTGTYPNPTITAGAVSTGKIADNAITTTKIADGAVTTAKIVDGAVTSAKIPSAQVVKSLNGVRDAVTFRAQGGATITSSGDTITINAGTGGGGVGVQSIQNTNNTLDVLNPIGPTVTVNVKSQGIGTTQLVDGSVTQAKIGTGVTLPPGGTAGGDLTGTYPNPTIGAGAVSGSKLADNAVTTAKIADGAVTTAKIADAAVTQAKLAPGLSLPPGGTAGGDLTGTYPNPTVATGAISTTKLADNSVTSAKIPTAQVVKSINTLKDNVTLAQGSNITITPSGNTLTIASAGWSLTGNAGTVDGTNFIGTTDNIPFTIRVNNQRAGRIYSTGMTFLGYQAGNSNTDPASVGIGYQALFSNTTGSANTASGHSALYSNTTGSTNTASGYLALRSNTTGNYNTASGGFALFSNTTGSENTASGLNALYSNTTGNYNTASGVQALSSNTTGNSNTASGYGALYLNTTGNANTASGNYALLSNTTGISNTASGVQALYANTSGGFNTASGLNALYSNTTGFSNTASGYNALLSNTNSYNTAYGVAALSRTTASQYNVAVGYLAGNAFNNGYNNVFLGANTDVNAAGLFNVIAVGQGTTVTASSTARFGNSATTSYGGWANWTNVSDGRYKKNVKEDVKGLDFIMKLRPVTYNLKVSELSAKLDESRGHEMNEQMKTAMAEKEKIIQSGFIAQEVEQAAKELGYDFSGVDAPKNDGDLYGLRYAEFVMPLVKAVQEQQKMIQVLQEEIKELRGQRKN